MILINKFFKLKKCSYTYGSERIIQVRIKTNKGFLSVAGVYPAEEKKRKLSEENILPTAEAFV
jgi:hypothetical protein